MQSLVGAGSRLAARSWVSPELAAQPAATHSRFSLRFLLRACCPGKNQGSLHNPLHVFKRRSWVWTKKTCWKMQEFAQNHSMPWVPGPRCLNWAQRERERERLPVDLTIPLAAYGIRFSSDIVSDDYYLIIWYTICISPVHLVRDHSCSLTFHKNWFRHCIYPPWN